MNPEGVKEKSSNDGSEWTKTDFPPFQPEMAKTETRVDEDKKYFEAFEKFRFDGSAIFTDIDGTLTDNSGDFDERAIEHIKEYRENGGTFVPVTGRARFESVRKIVEELDLPFIVINNGAEIFNRQGERIYGSEIPEEQVQEAFDIAKKNGLVWMQNKKDPVTGEEHLYSNFTEESEQAMLNVGIVDTVHNEEGRIGLTAKQATAEEVMAIPGQNYKIQMMSPDADAVQAAYDEFQRLGIPCMLNMQSKETGRFHWVEVIKGTKISGIQWLIDSGLVGDIKTARVVGDGGNDLTMFKELHNREGERIVNTYTAVANACDRLKAASHQILQSSYDAGPREIGKGGAMVEIFEDETRAREVWALVSIAEQLMRKKMLDERQFVDRVRTIRDNKKVRDFKIEKYPAA